MQVKEIGGRAFDNHANLINVTIPDTITSIGESAFRGCSGLTSVTLSEGLLTIGSFAFYGCAGITSFTVPGSVQTIGEDAFSYCAGLASIEFMEGIRTIERDAFTGCTGLKSVSFPDTLTRIEYRAFSKCTSLSSVTLSKGLTFISHRAFESCTGIKSLNLPDGLTVVGGFEGCTGLTSALMPEGVTSIGEGAFTGCSNLTEVHFPDSLTSISASAFSGCSSLTEVNFPDGLTSIGVSAFSGCSSLTALHLPDGLTSIDRNVFSDCSSLTEVHFPNGLTSIGDSAFSGCAKLSSVRLPQSLNYLSGFKNCASLASIEIPDSVTVIGSYAFYGCGSLKAVTIPENVSELKSYAFANCTGLSSIVIPSSVKSIQESFRGCSGLTSVTLSEGLLTIGYGAFYGCAGITSFTVPGSVQTIGESAFSYCASLASIEFKEGIRTIERHAFTGCTGLKSVSFPDTLTRIEYAAFDRCVNLTSVILSENITSLGIDYNRSEGEICQNCPKVTIYVMPDSFAEDYAQRHRLSYAYYYKDYGGVTLTLSVLDSENHALKSGYTVRWYEAGETAPVAYGTVFQGATPGGTYEYQVILGNELSARYCQSGRVTVGTAEPQLTCALTLRPTVTVTGFVKNEKGSPLPGAEVSFTQTVDERNTNITQVQTGSDGAFTAILLPDAETKVSISLYEHYPVTKTLSFSGKSANMGTIVLTGLPTNKITLTMTKREASLPGGQAEVSALTSADGLQFTLYNRTREREIADYTIQYPNIILADGQANGGDVILLRVADCSDGMRADDVLVTLDEHRIGAASVTFVENGFLRAELNEKTPAVLLAFVEDGSLSGRAVSDNRLISSPALKDGQYSVIVMKKTSLLPTVSSLQALSKFGLSAGDDYYQTSATVTGGAITDLGTVPVPALDESKLFHTVAANTFVSANAQSAVVGRYVSFKIQYEMDSQSESSEETVLVEFPDGLDFVENSVSKDGKSAPYTFDGHTLTVITGKDSSIIRLYALTTEAGSHTISASLRFRSGGDTLTQPLGGSVVEVKNAALSVPERTGSKEMIVSGKAIGQSAVKVYDGNTVVAETVANKGGSWSVKTPLLYPANNSTHNLHAEITTNSGITYSTGSSAVTYYDGYCEVERVTMYNTAHGDNNLTPVEFVTKFEFLKPDTSNHAYSYWPNYPDFTFVVELTGDAEEVSVITTDQHGDTVNIECAYDEISGNWIGTRRYTSYSAVPVGIAVSFTKNPQRGATQVLGRGVSAQVGENYDFTRSREPEAETPTDRTTFAVSGISPASGGTGKVTVAVSGKLLEPNAIVTLTNGSASRTAEKIVWVNHQKLYATFDLDSFPAGKYSLKASCGADSASLEDCFTVDPLLARGELVYDIHINETATYDTVYTGYVTATNVGYTDISAPILAIHGDNLLLGNVGNEPDSENLSVFLQNGSGLAGTLAHGETAGSTFSYRIAQSAEEPICIIPPANSGAEPSNRDVFSLRLLDYRYIDSSISSADSESLSKADAWLYAAMGNTYPAFAESAAEMADALSSVLENITLDDIISGYLQNLTGLDGTATPESVTDLLSADLAVMRAYSASGLSDDTPDLFGKVSVVCEGV